MHPSEPIYSFNIGKLIIDIKSESVIMFAIVLILGVIAWWATRDLKHKPTGKKQVIVEYLYTAIKSVVNSNMGDKYEDIIPYIGTLGVFLLVMNLTGLIGIVPPTKNFSVTITLGIVSFVVIQAYTIRRIGLGHYFLGYSKPMIMMLPINILERVMLPISLALRLFGNVLAATFLVELVYDALSSVTWIAQIGLPIPLHAYFDIFDGVIQMVIFVMLTMINIKITVEH